MTIEIQQLIIQARVQDTPPSLSPVQAELSAREKEWLVQEAVRRVWKKWCEKQEDAL